MDERDRDLLAAMLESCQVEERYARDQGPEWFRDPKTLDAVAKRVEEALASGEEARAPGSGGRNRRVVGQFARRAISASVQT